MAWHAVIVGVVASTMASCAVGDAFRGDGDVVARAGALTLHRDTLAAVLATAKNMPSRREVVEQWAYRWVEFALFGQRLAAGDSLLDSATVFYAMWPEADQWLVDEYHDELIAARVSLDSTTVDSVYSAGDLRMIYHILIRTTPDMAPPDKQAARAKAGQLLVRLNRGLAWAEANEQNDDPMAKRQGGSLGVIERGQMVPAFEAAAYELAPGRRSDIVETQFGYHVVWRPNLADVRADFEEAVEEVLVSQMDSVFLEELESRWNVKVRSDGPGRMREAAAAPLRTFKSSEVIGTFKDGRFTTADFVRWLQALPEVVHQGVSGASDEQLEGLARSLIRNEVLVRAAREAGAEWREEDQTSLRERLKGEIEQVSRGVGFDSALAGLETDDLRRQAVDSVIRTFYYDLAQGRRNAVVVPAFLAEKLRRDMRWDVSSAVIDETLQAVDAIVQARKATPGAGPAPTVTTDSTSDVPPK
jgi:hypothetical protein